MKNEAQHALDDLFNEKLIPFKLTAHMVGAEGPGIYTVRFFDSRLHSMTFSWKDGRSFKEVVRAAVLDRVKRMSPLERFWDRALRRKQVSQRPNTLG